MGKYEKQPDWLIEFARQNRKNLTLPEKLLWKRLQAPANSDIKIRRQYPILGQYILDNFYEDLQLAIEVDGAGCHEAKAEEDEIRQQKIEAAGIAFLRLPARFILRNPDEAADLVLTVCRGEIGLDELDEMFL